MVVYGCWVDVTTSGYFLKKFQSVVEGDGEGEGEVEEKELEKVE